VVAYAIAGRMDFDPYQEPLGKDPAGRPVFLSEVWPSLQEIADAVGRNLSRGEFRRAYADVFAGDTRWQGLAAPTGTRFAWSDDSTYIRQPPFFQGMSREAGEVSDIEGARCLALLGDSVTTDHISPAGTIKADSPAGRYLISHGVQPADFNSYGSRRGNHEVMMRGTFANIRLRNLMAPGTEGGVTIHEPSGEQMSIYDAALRYQSEDVPAIIIAGKEYGSGSSRDWAAKGPRLLGVRAVIAESYERIHRTNLVCMGVLPLQFRPGESPASLGLTGTETYAIDGLNGGNAKEVTVRVQPGDGAERRFKAQVRIDTPNEADYYRHGGILQYVLRRLAA
jgi:aconitate hydratase